LVFVYDFAKYYPRIHDVTQGDWLHIASLRVRSVLLVAVSVSIGIIGCCAARYVYVVRTWEFKKLNCACGCAYGFVAMLCALALCGLVGKAFLGWVPRLMGIAP